MGGKRAVKREVPGASPGPVERSKRLVKIKDICFSFISRFSKTARAASAGAAKNAHWGLQKSMQHRLRFFGKFAPPLGAVKNLQTGVAQAAQSGRGFFCKSMTR